MDTPEGRGTVVGINLLRQQVKVQMEEAQDIFHTFSVEDIAVLRNGKAKKNDPPIPADLAPISGSGKRRRAPEPEQEDRLLEPIKFRYRDEKIVEEPEPQEIEPTATDNVRTRRRRRHTKAETRKEAPAAQPLPEKTPAPVQAEKPKQSANHHRRRHYRRGKSQGQNSAE